MLRAMGVQVWHARGAADAGVPEQPAPAPVRSAAQAAPQQSTQPVPQVQQLTFAWLRSSRALIMYSSGDAAVQRLLKDLLSYIDWRAVAQQLQSGGGGGGGEESGRLRLQQGEFRWPQLHASGGTPARALAAWADKQQLQQLSWIGAGEDLMPQLAPWLTELGRPLVSLADLNLVLRDATAKKALWQQLNNNM